MVKVISIHSSRGGTGKSLISSNIAMIYASNGCNVAVLDFDFRAPSLQSIFQAKKLAKGWINDFLDGNTDLENVITDLTTKFKMKGKLFTGFADPEMKAMREMAQKDRKWQMRALRRVLSIKKELSEKLGVELILIDTSPGVQYSSVNAVVSSDFSLIVSSMDILDWEGVEKMVADLYEPFEKKGVILINKAIPHEYASGYRKGELLKQISKEFRFPVISIIPCYCDLLVSSRVSPFVLYNPNHPFSQDMKVVARMLKSF